MVSHEYTASHGLMQLLRASNNGPAAGTGNKENVEQAHNLFGTIIPPSLLKYNIATQNALFGGYPDHKDVAPCAVFIAAFSIIAILHVALFTINYRRGHYFWLSLGWAFYAVCRVIGFGFRMKWSFDLTETNTGIANEVFLIVPSIIFVSFNLILAQRLFTWRHPVGGSRKLFWNTMFALYFIVVLVITMTIVASAVPYLYFLSEHAFESYKNVVKVSAILIILYSLTSVALIALSYFFKPTTKDENLYTYQPWWIESFLPLYFPRKNAAQEAEETFMKRNHNHRHAIRVIAATHHHYKMVEGLTNQRGNLTHNVSLGIICFSTVLIFVGAIMRAIIVFSGVQNRDMISAGDPVVMYICWGLFEFLINVVYIVGRVDLRFYRPDVLPAKVRDIITAEQSAFASHAPSRAGSATHSVAPSLAESYAPSVDSADFNFSEVGTMPPRYSDYKDRFDDDKERLDTFTEDNESEFHF